MVNGMIYYTTYDGWGRVSFVYPQGYVNDNSQAKWATLL
jgi:hypothetical protein